jgi:hypothetical protein
MLVKSVLGGLGLGLLLAWAPAWGQIPDLPPSPPPLGPASAVPGRAPQPPSPQPPTPAPPRNVPAPTLGPPAQPPAASLPATTIPTTPVPPAPGLPAETVPFIDTSGALFPSAMAGSAAVSAVSSSNAALFGEGPAVSAGLLSSRRLTSGPDYQMIGDQAPTTLRQALPPAPGLPPPFPPGTPPSPPSPRLASAIVPSVRGFKIAENQSPQPQDRVFFTFDYFSDLNGALNRRFESPVNNLTAFRYIFGFEKTFDEGFGSFGFRLPLDQLSANSAISGNFAKPGGTSTSLNDLSLFTKYVLKADPATGSLLSVGLEATLPTGPSQFAGAKYIQGIHSTEVQPFLGYLLIRNRFYLHGFLSLSAPSSVRDVTMVYNDLGIGYFVYRSTDPDSALTSVAPTFEVHVNSPLTHRDWFNANDPTGTADVVDLTYGLNVTFYRQSVITLGMVTPVTGPRPFNYEAVLLFNWRFGRSRAAAAPPIVGG